MKDEYDFSKGERGKFYREGATSVQDDTEGQPNVFEHPFGENSTSTVLEDNFAEAFKASRGKVDPKVKLGF